MTLIARRRLPACLLIGLVPASFAQTVARPAAQPPDLFDFWIGDWQARWKNADGSEGRGRNVVSRLFEGQALEERFDEDPAAPNPLRGRSISVLHQASGLWRQAWADNQGGFFSLTAAVEGERRIFATELADGQRGQRMVFHSIRPQAFTWDWEGTKDGGRSWARLWQIEYRR